MGDNGTPNDEDVILTYSSRYASGDVASIGDQPFRILDSVSGAGLFTQNSDPQVANIDPLTGLAAPLGTDVGFGSALRRYIQTGVLNGSFSLLPPRPFDPIDVDNPLPYWTWTPPDGTEYAVLESAASYGSPYAFRVVVPGGTAGGGVLEQWVAIPASQGQQYRVLLSAFGGNSDWTLRYQFYQYDAATAIGSEISTAMILATEVKVDAGLVPPQSYWMRLRIVTGTTGAYLGEVRAAFLPAESTLGLKSLVAATGAIANSQAQIIGITVPAGSFTLGSTYRITAYGVATNTSGGAVATTFRVRCGPTTLTGNIAGSRAPNMAIGASADGWKVEFLFTVRSVGASGTAIANGTTEGGPSQPWNTNSFVSPTTATVAVDTTVANILELTVVTGNANASVNATQAVIECIMAS